MAVILCTEQNYEKYKNNFLCLFCGATEKALVPGKQVFSYFTPSDYILYLIKHNQCDPTQLKFIEETYLNELHTSYYATIGVCSLQNLVLYLDNIVLVVEESFGITFSSVIATFLESYGISVEFGDQ